MTKKRKRKVSLPTDRDGTPINIDDWLMFSDGPFHIETLTYYGNGVGSDCWTAENEDKGFCDNLGAGKVISI